MDIFAMLQTAVIVDLEMDEVVGQSLGFQVVNGRLRIMTVLFDREEDDDPDDGEKEDIPEEDTDILNLRHPTLAFVAKEGTGTNG